MSNSLQPYGLQHTRPPSFSPSPKVCPRSCTLHRWWHPTILSSDALFYFCPQSFPASGTFPVSQLSESADQNAGFSALASVLPMNIQGWFLLRLTGLISLLSKGLWGVFSSTTVWRHQFFSNPSSLQSSSHNRTWLLERPSVQFSSVQSLSRVLLFATPWIAAHQPSLSITNSQSLLKPMSIKLVMPSSHLILCSPLLLLPPVPSSIRGFSNESPLRMRWPK